MAQLSAYSGASGDIFNHTQPNSVKRSKFDLSRITNLTCDSGMIIPFDWLPTLPGDMFDISAEVGLESMPTVTNILTPYRVRTHWYYLRYSDLWAGWNTFITKGRSGDVSLKIPQIQPSQLLGDSFDDWQYCFDLPHSLSSFLGCLPTHQIDDEHVDSFGDYHAQYGSDQLGSSLKSLYKPTKYSALPFMAYQNICKYNYVNQNLLQDNHSLFPVEGDSDWRLPYKIANASTDNLVNTVSGVNLTVVNDDDTGFSYDGVYNSTEKNVSLLPLRYAQFDDDYFTSALPWLQRGQVKTLPFDVEEFDWNTYGDVRLKNLDLSVSDTIDIGSVSGSGNLINAVGGSSVVDNRLGVRISDIATSLRSAQLQSSITANQFRELIAMSVWQERNARVNGSYNSMIWIHWNHNPKVEEHQPIFIGGSSSYVDFSQVLQNSQSTKGENGSPLGTSVSRGTMYDDNRIGRFHCPDYGIIMGILIISPVTTYNTAVEHSLVCENVMEDYPFPEFENLSPQPVLNKEIFVSGDESKDNGLFAYQERLAYLKSRVNVNRGLFRLPKDSDILFSSASQSREFRSTPKISYQFVVQSPQNTRRDWLAFMSEPMFKVQVASKINAVRPISYSSTPNTFGF